MNMNGCSLMLTTTYVPFQSIICYCKPDNGSVYNGYDYSDMDVVNANLLCHTLGHTIQLLK